MKFLMVEDDPVHTELITAQLEEIGAEVESTPTVARAIRLLGEGSEYDLVILDRKLTDGDGFEVQRCLNNAQNPPPVLFVTSEDVVEEAVEAMRDGAMGYVIKRPDYLTVLEKEVSRILSTPRSVGVANRTEYEDRERVKLIAALERSQWNVSAAARELGMGRGKLRSRMAALGIDA